MVEMFYVAYSEDNDYFEDPNIVTGRSLKKTSKSQIR
jgi:hypothetical protein